MTQVIFPCSRRASWSDSRSDLKRLVSLVPSLWEPLPPPPPSPKSPQNFGHDGVNPVIPSAERVYKATRIVELNANGIGKAAKYIKTKMESMSYSPLTWRTQPLHLLPPLLYDSSNPRTKDVLDWIFFVSALNFSFWSDLPESSRYGVEWHANGWDAVGNPSPAKEVWTGYWSLLAATNKALESGIPITDPWFYSSTSRCSDELIKSIFASAPSSLERIPLLNERIRILREVGKTMCDRFGGSFQGLLQEFELRYGESRTALDLVRMVVENFSSFRDECECDGATAQFWKRAQILVAETWAAFHPESTNTPHPFFPHGISQLTMFADYRVPQIMHSLNILTYPPHLLHKLQARTPLAHGSNEEMSIRAASILGVERVKERILLEAKSDRERQAVTSVLIDFWLWDMAKELEAGRTALDGEGEGEAVMGPIHRTRSIWY